ncbi:MAG: methyltransferase domain-containing protein [Myxococcota bacterium]
MSTGLQFDADLARALELQYQRPQMVLRRAAALRLAAPKLGEDVLDVGCGPGFLCNDLAAGVGERGSVLGVDQSESMLGLAKARCAGWPWARFELGDAASLPADDAAFDLVMSTQVLEYVSDIDRALSEIARVLRPGGRTLLLATDWRSVAWHSSDDARMDRMLAAWEEHLAHPALPRTLAARLEARGLRVGTLERYSIVERADERTGYAAMLMGTLPGYCPGRRGVTEDEAQAWLADLEALRERGEFHLSVGQYFFCATKG